MTEYKFENQTSLLIQKNDDGTFLVAVGKKTFEGTHVSMNFVAHKKEGVTKYFAGLDDPEVFELYEDIIFDCDVNVEPDESLSIDLRL